MWKTFALILPVLIPSWRFFKAVDPSPRVQWALVGSGHDAAWRDFRPRPQRVRLGDMLRRLVWNPDWNDTLFVVSCAERIEQLGDAHAVSEISRRILRDPALAGVHGRMMHFRLVFVHHDGARVVQDVVYTADPVAVP